MNRNESHNKFALAVLSQLNKINIVYNGFIESPISYTVVLVVKNLRKFWTENLTNTVI